MLRHKYCYYENQFYIEEDELPRGSPLSPTHYLHRIVIPISPKAEVIIYARQILYLISRAAYKHYKNNCNKDAIYSAIWRRICRLNQKLRIIVHEYSTVRHDFIKSILARHAWTEYPTCNRSKSTKKICGIKESSVDSTIHIYQVICRRRYYSSIITAYHISGSWCESLLVHGCTFSCVKYFFRTTHTASSNLLEGRFYEKTVFIYSCMIS